MKLSITDELRYIGEQTSRFIPGEIYKIHSIDAKGVWVMPNCRDHNSTRVIFYHIEFDQYFEVVREDGALPVEPIVLTKGQEEAVTLVKTMTDDINLILMAHSRKFELAGETYGMGWEVKELEALNELSVVDLATALLVGYKVELTAEEKAIELLQSETPELYEIYKSGSLEYQKGVLDALIAEVERNESKS